MAYKFALPLLLALAMLPAQAKMYKWVDAQGNVHYTDALPPNAAGQGNAELSKTGKVVKKTESAEEKSARLSAEEEAAKLKKLEKEQKRKDKALLFTYTTEKEIDLARDRTLEHHQLAIRSAQARLKQLEPITNELAKKIEDISKKGKPVPAHLNRQHDAKRSEVEDALRTIKTNEEAAVAVRERYESDKVRFRELTEKR